MYLSRPFDAVFKYSSDFWHKFNSNLTFLLTQIRSLVAPFFFIKTLGPDSVHPRLLRECQKALSYPLCMLFRLSLQNGELPHDWKTSYITPNP